MDGFALDASVAISWCFPSDPAEDTPYSREVLARLEAEDAIVPGIWPFEIANSLFVSFAVRKRITEIQIKEYLERLRALPIHVESQEHVDECRIGSSSPEVESDSVRCSLSRPRAARRAPVGHDGLANYAPQRPPRASRCWPRFHKRQRGVFPTGQSADRT